VTGGWSRKSAKLIAITYRDNLIWDAERDNLNLALIRRGGQI